MSTVARDSRPHVLREARDTLIILGVLLVLLLYSYGNALASLWSDHWNNPQYSHGYLVPLFAAILLWMRWDPSAFQPADRIPSAARWWGAGLLAAGLSLRLMSAHFGMEVPDMVTFVPSVAGAVLLAGGWPLFRWAGPIVAFLIFMFPLPWRVAQALLVPLQKVATVCSTYFLQVMGYGAYREENVIHVAGVPMEVVDACSGLRMLTVFLALCAAVAMVIERPMWERIVVFLSALPIALAVNVVRITATGMAHYHIGGPWVSEVFHDHAGYVMMPLAMVLLYVEIFLLGKVFIDVEGTSAESTEPVGRQKTKKESRSRREPVPYRPASLQR